MTIAKMFQMLATMFEVKQGPEPIRIKPKLIWRDRDNKIIRERFAEFGYCSGLSPVMIVEIPAANTTNWQTLIEDNNGLTKDQALELLRHVI